MGQTGFSVSAGSAGIASGGASPGAPMGAASEGRGAAAGGEGAAGTPLAREGGPRGAASGGGRRGVPDSPFSTVSTFSDAGAAPLTGFFIAGLGAPLLASEATAVPEKSFPPSLDAAGAAGLRGGCCAAPDGQHSTDGHHPCRAAPQGCCLAGRTRSDRNRRGGAALRR